MGYGSEHFLRTSTRVRPKLDATELAYCTYCGVEIDPGDPQAIHTEGPHGEYYCEDCAGA